ncbi:MAG: hypothetical protein WD995_08245 [Gemmatimonadota bacterium]
MSSDTQFWHRIGYALERAKEGPSEAGSALSGLTDRVRKASPRKTAERVSPFPLPDTDHLVALGLTALAGKLLSAWKPRHDTGVTDLLRAGLTGAGAALLVELARPLLKGDRELPVLDGETFDRVLTGVAQGLAYAAVVEPRLPGPGAVRGALYGVAEYAVVPLGGLAKVFGRATPQGRVPVLGNVLERVDARDRAFLEHLAFGVVIGALYGVRSEKSGIRVERGDA